MGNPKDSPWYATPRIARKRKPLAITLSDEAAERLELVASREYGGNKSALIEGFVMGLRVPSAKV